LNPTNGAVYWREPTVSGGSPGFAAVSTPVIQGDRLLLSGLMFQLRQDPARRKSSLARHALGTRRILSDTSTPLLKDNSVYSPRSGGCLSALMPRRGRNGGKPTPSLNCGKAPVFT